MNALPQSAQGKGLFDLSRVSCVENLGCVDGGLTWEMLFRRECRDRCQGRVVHLGAAIEPAEKTISTMQMLRASGRRIQRQGSGWS